MNYIPDSTTFACFRVHLCKLVLIKELFEMFEGYLRDQGLEARGGQIVNATLVPVQSNVISEKKSRFSRLIAYQMDGMKTQIVCSIGI